jgi:hydrogenase maturation protease
MITVLGIGSPFGDDQVGNYIAEQLSQMPCLQAYLGKSLQIHCLDRPGVNLLNYFAPGDESGESQVIIIDAMCSGQAIGHVQTFTADTLPTEDTHLSTHSLGVLPSLALAKALHQLPKQCRVYAVEIATPIAHKQLSSEIKAAADLLCQQITQALIKTLSLN